MLLINRLKAYHFSLEEIKTILAPEELQEDKLVPELIRKIREIERQMQELHKIYDQLTNDITVLKQGKSIMSYIEDIDVRLVEVPKRYLISIRKKVQEYEFAIPVQEYITGTREFSPRLCLKTVVKGSYSQLTSVYARQQEWAEQQGYISNNALFEVYINDPSQVTDESSLLTEVYLPVSKKQ